MQAVRFCCLLLLVLRLAAQTPSFEVASVRSSAASLSYSLGPPLICQSVTAEPRNVQVVTTLNILVAEAYENEFDRFDLPPYSRDPRVAVSVRVPANTTRDSCRKMLQNLLSERFHLVTGVELRQVPTYFLKVAKSGLKLKAVQGPPADVRAAANFNSADGHWTVIFRAAPIERIVLQLGTITGLLARYGGIEIGPLLNETGLSGYYDGKFEYDSPPRDRDAQFSQGPVLNNALVSQLGLAIETRKAAGKVMMIRSADRTPTKN